VRFVSQEVCLDKGFLVWHFLYYCFVQIVLLWSLSIEVRIIFITNELVHKIFHHLQKDKQRNNDTQYVKLGKKWRESSKHNYYVIAPRVIIKATIIRVLKIKCITEWLGGRLFSGKSAPQARFFDETKCATGRFLGLYPGRRSVLLI